MLARCQRRGGAPWARLLSIVEFAGVAVVIHERHVDFDSSDTRTGGRMQLDAAHVTPVKSCGQMFLRSLS